MTLCDNVASQISRLISMSYSVAYFAGAYFAGAYFAALFRPNFQQKKMLSENFLHFVSHLSENFLRGRCARRTGPSRSPPRRSLADKDRQEKQGFARALVTGSWCDGDSGRAWC